ncbi:hypothetical protein TeGR_g1025, partial [Tetraparma gracilis]
MPTDTPLHKAAHQGSLPEVKEIIQEGEISVDAEGAGGRRALHRAAGGNHTKIITYLLSQGAVLDQPDRSGRTALHWSAISGHVEATEMLLGKGSDPLAESQSKMTALHGAADRGHVAVVRLLLETDGREHLQRLFAAVDEDGKSASTLAREADQRDVLEVLKEFGDPGAMVVAGEGYISTPEDAGTLECLRDNWINARGTTPWKLLDALYILLVITDGAFFFFLLMGWTTMNEEDKNCWLNWSIQVLCGLFSYPAVVELPWRLGNLVSLASGEAESGDDFYGN